jgi:hypothetical protein
VEFGIQAVLAVGEGLTCGQFLADRALGANWLRAALMGAGIALRCCKTGESCSTFISLAATIIRLK